MNHPNNHSFQPQHGGPQFPPPAFTPPAKPKSKKWPIVVTGIAALFLGYNVGSVGEGTETATADPQPTATVTTTATVPVEKTDEPEAEPAEKKEKAKKEKKAEPAGFGNGTYLIGDEMPAGRYKVTVPDDSWGCYWERNSDDSGEFDAIIANEAGEPGANMSVTVNEGEFFNTSDCGEWVAA